MDPQPTQEKDYSDLPQGKGPELTHPSQKISCSNLSIFRFSADPFLSFRHEIPTPVNHQQPHIDLFPLAPALSLIRKKKKRISRVAPAHNKHQILNSGGLKHNSREVLFTAIIPPSLSLFRQSSKNLMLNQPKITSKQSQN